MLQPCSSKAQPKHCSEHEGTGNLEIDLRDSWEQWVSTQSYCIAEPLRSGDCGVISHWEWNLLSNQVLSEDCFPITNIQASAYLSTTFEALLRQSPLINPVSGNCLFQVLWETISGWIRHHKSTSFAVPSIPLIKCSFGIHPSHFWLIKAVYCLARMQHRPNQEWEWVFYMQNSACGHRTPGPKVGKSPCSESR